jgi:Fur family iron response transcriptional regulator
MRSTGSKSAGEVPRNGHGTKADFAARLRHARLRPTQQRLALARLLFSGCDRHVTAEDLHGEALKGGARLSLATVYNTLHQFTQAGLLRQVIVDGDKIHFDTNTGEHHHFYVEDEGVLIDIPGRDVRIEGLPKAPSGKEIERVEIVVRLKTR